MSLADLIAFLVGFLLTLMVLSYLVGDNPLFRLAVHLFIGAAAGYAGAVALQQVIVPNLWDPLIGAFDGGSLEGLGLALPPLFLALLLLAKLSTRVAWLGNPAMAYLVGVGAAVAVGGSLLGTLLPQTGATIDLFDLQAARASGVAGGERLLEASIMLVGTVSTLMYFHFGVRSRGDQPARRSRLVEALAWVGQVFIASTFGVLFAGVYAAALAALVERVNYLWDLRLFLGSFF